MRLEIFLKLVKNESVYKMKQRVIIILVCMSCLVACGRSLLQNQEPDDAISESISKVIDNDEIYYLGKQVTQSNIVFYEYVIRYEEVGQIEQIAQAVNEVIKVNPKNEKLSIKCMVEVPGGGALWAASVKNYTEETEEIVSGNALQVLIINDGVDGSIFNEPSTYANIKGIKRLELYPEMNQRAEKQGIDWYDYWPELESIEVLSP